MAVDLIARWGGDEFIAVLPDVNKQSAYKLAQRLRVKVEEDKGLKEILDKSITISMGIATRTNETNIEELFLKVDKNLYQAKKEGRNKIVL
ncbi:MAG: GGDEF domain-containing protein [Poseidonibacter sp.]